MDSDKPEIVIRYTLCDSGYTAVSAERITDPDWAEVLDSIPYAVPRSVLLEFAVRIVVDYEPTSLGVSIAGGPIRLISRRTVEDIKSGKRIFDDLLVG